MVNFNDSNTVTTPSLNINKVLILQRRAEFIDIKRTYESELIQLGQAREKTKADTIAYFKALIDEIESMIERREKTMYDQIMTDIQKNDITKIKEAFKKINKFLDELDLTKIDTRKQIDTSQIEEMNQYKGL